VGAIETLEQNIMQALKKVGLKRKNAADLLKIDPPYFNRMLKSGRWQLRYLEALANLLKTPLWKLFYDGDGLTDAVEGGQGLYVLPAGERPAPLALNEFVEVPVVKLQVEMDFAEASTSQESLWTMFVKEDLVHALSPGKKLRAIELKIKVK